VTVNLIFIGHLNDASKIASCGLGNILIFIFANAAYIGMNSGMETLVSQAYGAKNLMLCGEHYQRGRIAIMLYWFPLIMIFFVQGMILRALGQK
jgi:Na+-driven multidrug efflux pump